VLISFGGFAASGLDLTALGRWTDRTFVFAPPLPARPPDLPRNVLLVDEPSVEYLSLLAACDAVVAKPGYGIVTDCLANQVPVLFTERGPFREYDVLAEALTTLGRAYFVPRAVVLAGNLGPYLDTLDQLTTSWTAQRMDGAQVVAQRTLAQTA
jgi:UDP-N-acetylglucosamine:LPS N-acetylglucosamine transferase